MAGQLLLYLRGEGGYLGTIGPLEGPYKGFIRPPEALLYPDSPPPPPGGNKSCPAIALAFAPLARTPSVTWKEARRTREG